MKTLPKKRALCTALLLTISLLLPVFAVAAPEAVLTLDAPESVGVGQPFLVRLSFPVDMEQLEIIWDDSSLHPAVATTDDVSNATVLLGVGLKAEPGLRTLEIRARVYGEIVSFQKNISILPHEYQSETLSVDPAMITPPQELADRIKHERALSLEAIRTYSPQRMWEAPLALPVKGKMLSRFGLHRVFNGESKRRHKGLDFRAWMGTPIHSIAAGTVVLVGDFYYAGNCVFIDHGNGVVSMSVHMSEVLVEEGDRIERGQRIGLSGATGRTNGAHLHLSVFAQGVAIDPEPLFFMEETQLSKHTTRFPIPALSRPVLLWLKKFNIDP